MRRPCDPSNDHPLLFSCRPCIISIVHAHRKRVGTFSGNLSDTFSLLCLVVLSRAQSCSVVWGIVPQVSYAMLSYAILSTKQGQCISRNPGGFYPGLIDPFTVKWH